MDNKKEKYFNYIVIAPAYSKKYYAYWTRTMNFIGENILIYSQSCIEIFNYI